MMTRVASDVARPLKCRILASELGRGAIASSGVTTRSKTWSFEKVGRNPSQVFYTETGGSLPKSYQDSHPNFRYLKNPRSSQMDVDKFQYHGSFCIFSVPGFDACIKGGVKLFDTAEIYGPGRSEARSRSAEKP